MALPEGILVCLTDRSMSGYDLAKSFDAAVGFFWHVSHQQIYRELSKLRDKGFVESHEVIQKGKPNRIENKITQAGRDHLREWSKKPSPLPSVKDDLVLKFYAISAMDIDAIKDQITIRLDVHKERNSRYKRMKEKQFDNNETLSPDEKVKHLLLELAIEEEEKRLEWWQKSLEKIIEIYDRDKI